MKRKTKVVIVAAAVVVVAGASMFSLAAGRDSDTAVTLEAVEARDLEAIVGGTGYIRPRRRVDISADVSGRIIELAVKEGDAVRTNDLLLRIDPAQHQAAVRRARAELSAAQSREAQARAELIQAEREYERMTALASATEASLVSQQSVEEAQTRVEVQVQTLEAATFGVAQAQAMLEEAEDRVQKTIIRSPMEGVVTRLNVDEGETAIVGTMNNPGSLLLTVADLAVMEAVIRVDETDVPELTIGDSAAIQIDAFPRRTFAGRVSEIAHSSVRPPESMQTGTGQGQAVDFEIVITLDEPPSKLRSDLSASADIITGARQGVLSIPIIALTVRERGDDEVMPQEDPEAQAAASVAAELRDVEGAFVIRDGAAHFVPVDVGIAGREYFEVLSGLTREDSVIAGPYEAIRALEDGSPVRRMPATSGDQAGPRAAGSG